MKTINKLKVLGTTLFAGAFMLNTQAQDNRNVGDFTGVKVGDSFEVIITQGENNSVKVETTEDNLSKVKTEVKDGILIISTDGVIKSAEDIIINIEAKNLTSIDVTGAAEVKTKTALTSQNITIESNGAGDVNLELKAGEIKTKISGAGDITLKGTCDLLDASVNGAGSLKASNLEATKVKAKVSGAGDARVNVKQSLDADVSGAGSIIYKGNPVDRNVNISGAGSVRESHSGTGDETASDTTKFKLGNKKYIIIGDGEEEDEKFSYEDRKDSIKNKNEKFKHWAGYELGVNGLLDYNNSFTMPSNGTFLELDYSKSIQFGVNLFEKDFHIYKNYINLVTGFGFDFNHYAFKNNITLNGDTTYLNAFTDNIDYKKNKLNVSYVKAPLMLVFNTSKNPSKNFHISTGVEVAYRIHAVQKQKYDIGDTHFKSKRRDDFNLEQLRYSAVARIGYNRVSFFATYGLNRLFQKNKGPQVYPFTAGVALAFN